MTLTTRNKRVPTLRRTFPPLESGRKRLLRARNKAAFGNEPRLAELEKRLLDMGGLMALLFLPDNQVGELLDRGRYFPGSGAQLLRDQESACHSNASMLFYRTEGSVRIASGYALSADGL